VGYINKIKSGLENYSPTERKIAIYIVNNIELLKDATTHSLASLLQVAQSSISKFAKKVGAKGFTELKISIISENKTENEPVLHSSINKSDSLQVIAEKLILEKRMALEKTTHCIHFPTLTTIIHALDKARLIQITGLGASALAGKDLAFKLMKIGYNVACEVDSHVQLTVAQALTPADVQIVLSYSGRKKEINLAAHAAKAKGATVIAITSVNKSPLRRIAHYAVDTLSNEDEWRSSSISSRTAQNCITDLIFIGLLQLHDLRSLNMIKQSRELIGKLE